MELTIDTLKTFNGDKYTAIAFYADADDTGELYIYNDLEALICGVAGIITRQYNPREGS